MDDLSRSSFIPKQVGGTAPRRSSAPRRFHVLEFISGFLLVAALLLSLGTFLYKGYLERQLEGTKRALTENASQINLKDLEEVEALDRQLGAAEYLLNNHLSPSKLFDSLERTTNTTVQFGGFSYARRPSGGVDVELNGLTEEFKSVALQSEHLNKSNEFNDTLLTALAFSSDVQTESGQTSQSSTQTQQKDLPAVSFSLSADIAASKLGYSGLAQTTDTTFTPAEVTPDPPVTDGGVDSGEGTTD